VSVKAGLPDSCITKNSTDHVEASASGKVILFGEHAVVHGVTAIAAGISRGARARARFCSTDSLQVNNEPVIKGHDLYVALRSLRDALSLPTAALEIDLDLPAGCGLGASAAMGIAVARALLLLNNKASKDDDMLFRAVQSWEGVFHGTPSGVDVAAAQCGGAIRFTKDQPPEPLMLNRPLHLAIAEAGPPASTKAMIKSVANFKKKNSAQFNRTLEGIAALVDNANLLLRSGDLQAVGKLMDLNHMLLAGWMLSTEEIENSRRIARNAGALGAKLTGAGGGGCVIALAPESRLVQGETDPAAGILRAWRAAGIQCFSARVENPTSANHRKAAHQP